MTDSTKSRIPSHLHRYIVDQNYDRYTSEDQAVWRFIMRQLRDFLSRTAHPSYLQGLSQTGISIDRIPAIEDIDAALVKFGWGAVPVSGFIPPAAFMEFQSIGVLPIASDMRILAHLLYTPAPDIVHEAAGHAPILSDPDYANYLRLYGSVARHAILSKEDLDQYEAIRILSDIKEDPRSTPDDIARAERHLHTANQNMRFVSEASLLSRMNWWTAEYGLVGDIKNPRIFGAGLLSSVGEARACLEAKIKKIPLSVECVDYGYDITEPQPQLFVTPDFAFLGQVLEEFAARMSYRRGGVYGLRKAAESLTVNSVQLDSSLQISGILKDFVADQAETPIYFQFEGPSQLAFEYKELSGQGRRRHPHGFSSPVGLVQGFERPLHQATAADLGRLGLRLGEIGELKFVSGVHVRGVVREFIFNEDRLLIITWSDCTVQLKDRVLFDPAWGEFDMAVGSQVVSVFGGAADRGTYGAADEFVAKRVPARIYSRAQQDRFAVYQNIRQLRELAESKVSDSERANLQLWQQLSRDFTKSTRLDWLQGVELLELAYILNVPTSERETFEKILSASRLTAANDQQSLLDGIRLASVRS